MYSVKVKEESVKVDLKLNSQKKKIMTSGPITSWQINGETMETVTDSLFLGSKMPAEGDGSHEIKRRLLSEREANSPSIPSPTFITSKQLLPSCPSIW